MFVSKSAAKTLHGALLRAVLIAAVLILTFPVLPKASAGVYQWTGGHDAPGWSKPAPEAYFAEGSTRNGFEEWLYLRNPNTKTASTTVTYYFPPPDRPRTQKFSLDAGAGQSIHVNDVVGQDKDLSIVVTANPGIISERQMYFNYKGVWTGGHVTCGASSPSATWYFAEGNTRKGFQEWLCLQNPWDYEVTATLTYMLGTGENITGKEVMDARSRKTVDVAGAVGREKDVSVKVVSEKPIVAERPMYFDYKSAWRGGHTVTGATALSHQWYFAEGTTRQGFEEWLCIQNPGPETTARVEYLFTDKPQKVRSYPVAARSRTTISVNKEVGPDRDVSIKITSGGSVLCERPMYFCFHGEIEGGHVVIGSTAGQKTWQFPVAVAADGFQPYLCVMNPGGTKTSVKVEVLGDGGTFHGENLDVKPQARATLDLAEASKNVTFPWVRVTAGADVIVERPVYFTYDPAVEPEPFTFATWNGLELKSPIRYSDLLGFEFHESASTDGNGKPTNAQVLQPAGLCLRDDNPARRYPGVHDGACGDPAYWVEDSRGRGTYSTTACDVQSKTGARVLSPVDGTVLAAESYLLYGHYPDLRAKVLIDGHPGYQVAVLHMSSLTVKKGDKVKSGETQVGTVRNLVPYFNSGPNPYTREEGNHAHVQINYRPDEHL